MSKDIKSPSFASRLACFISNIIHINRLTHRVAVNEERLDAMAKLAGTIQQRLDTLEILAHTSQQRLEALETIASVSQRRLDVLEAAADAARQRFDMIETSIIPGVEKALTEQMYSQVRASEKRLDQERLFNPAPVRRPRLAFVSPLPPERSGISEYSAELLPELARYYEIDVIAVQAGVTDSWVDAYCPVRSVEWFRRHASDYARVVYQFGNSPFHSHMFALLREHPGAVVLHDFYLSSVLAYEESTGALPGIWTEALYRSHGYLAVQASFGENGVERARDLYPSNLEVLQGARGMIVHSDHARQLACRWYGEHAADGWHVIPLLRAPVANLDRKAARESLGFGDKDFVLCSFGFIDPVKLNHRMLDAWLASSLREDPNCRLVLVGANHPGEYGSRLLERIRNSGCQDRIRITGWTDDTTYKQYLQAADAGVQLRGLSRGETSAAVLQCMNYGLPTIVNASGSMAELPSNTVWKLPEEFDDTELIAAMETLWNDQAKRVELGRAAAEFIHVRHNPDVCAKQYAEAIESIYANADPHPDQDSKGQSSRKPAFRQLLVDVSAIARNDLQTGIERVVRAQLSELLRQPPAGIRIEPVMLSDEGGEWHYHYARSYTCKLLGIASAALADDPIEVAPGDVFYAPDYFPDGMIKAADAGIYARWRAMGVKTHFLVHDLLPVLRPEFFPEHADKLHAAWLDRITDNANTLVCISHAVADELRTWIGRNKHLAVPMPKIEVVYHGADIAASAPTCGLPEDAVSKLEQFRAVPSFLMVGTIEPRKGHLQTLSAFEQLWSVGEQVNLVIVGKAGWTALPDDQRSTIPEIVERISKHSELGKRLFWLQGISDEYLQKTYAACTCLIFASEGEGFGLPLIEAARHELPVIVRDLPVFREVAHENAFYFNGLSPTDLAAAIREWLRLHKCGTTPAPISKNWRTWAQNAQELFAVLSEHAAPELTGLPRESQ